MTLVSTDWLDENLHKVKIIDASWHLDKNRNAIEEYNKEHIENAIFFDLDKNSNQKKNLPHPILFVPFFLLLRWYKKFLIYTDNQH